MIDIPKITATIKTEEVETVELPSIVATIETKENFVELPKVVADVRPETAIVGNLGTMVAGKGKDGKDGVDGRPGKDGIDGKPGRDGINGKDGKDGITPHIGDNGNWFIDDFDTGVCAVGRNGLDGVPGKDGYTPRLGIDYFNGKDGKDGRDGRDGVDGKTPVKGVDYFDGQDGKDGKDGKNGRTPIKGIDYKDGKDGKDGKNGLNGLNGTDGFSPKVLVEEIEGGHKITITDKDGEKSFDVMDGQGDNGDGGTGENGFSPTISVEEIENGHRITITDVDGTKIIDVLNGKNGIDGKDGYTPIKGVDYFDGLPGADGRPGEPGKDGYTPVKGVDYFDGLPGKDGKDGVDGYTPVKGTDYFTPDEVSEMVQRAVKEVLKITAPGSIRFGEGRLYAPATTASYTVTNFDEDSVTFQYKGGGGVEELVFPITGLLSGRTYTISFSETYNGGFIQDTYRYGCGIMQKSTYESTTFPTTQAKPSWIAWHTGSTGTQSGAITFTAQSDTVYWVWSLGRLSDNILNTITFEARLF